MSKNMVSGIFTLRCVPAVYHTAFFFPKCQRNHHFHGSSLRLCAIEKATLYYHI